MPLKFGIRNSEFPPTRRRNRRSRRWTQIATHPTTQWPVASSQWPVASGQSHPSSAHRPAEGSPQITQIDPDPTRPAKNEKSQRRRAAKPAHPIDSSTRPLASLGMTASSSHRPLNPTEVLQVVIPTEERSDLSCCHPDRSRRRSGGIHSTRFARSGQACGARYVQTFNVNTL
jgi:hypothetical protein